MKFELDFLLLAHQLTGIGFTVIGGLVMLTGIGMLTGTVNWMR